MSDVRSMTGFAALDRSGAEGSRGFSLSIKAVNHRHLDLSVRVPSGLDALEPALRAAVKAEVRRGHVELTFAFEKMAAGTMQLDEGLLDEYARMFERANAKLSLGQTVDLNAMLRLPGMLVASAAVPHSPGVDVAVMDAVAELLTAFNDARRREGESLAAELRAAMTRLQKLAAETGDLRQGVGASEFARLKMRLADLLGGGLWLMKSACLLRLRCLPRAAMLRKNWCGCGRILRALRSCWMRAARWGVRSTSCCRR